MRRVELRGRLVHPYWKRRLHHLGDGAVIYRPEWLFGPHLISIGSRAVIMQGVRLSVERQAWADKGPIISIGDRVAIARFCTISAAASVTIEDDVGIAAFTTIVDNEHTWGAGNPHPLYNPLVTAPIRIGRGTWVGERVTIMKGADIGSFCIIGPNTLVRGKVPSYSVAIGTPARILRQATRWRVAKQLLD